MLFFNCHTHYSKSSEFEIFQGEIIGLEVYHSLGIPPWFQFSELETEISLLNAQISKKNCLALGEIGLDKMLDIPMQNQIELFERQVELSEKEQLPIIIHCVKAWNELKNIKKRMDVEQKWIFHGFSKLGILKDVLDENMMVSIGAAIINHPKSEEIIEMIPNDQLLLETDNSDFPIEEVYNFVAEIKKISLQQLAEIIEYNFKNTFRKWHIGSNEQNY